MSTTTTSPGGQHAVGDLVVRAGGVRAGPDDHEVHGGVPLGQDGLGDHRPTARSVSPGRSQPGTRRVHPVDGGAGLAQGRDLGRRLADPQRRAARARPAPGRAPGSASRNFSTDSAHIRSESPTVATGPSKPRPARTGRRSPPRGSSPGRASRPGRPAPRPAPAAARTARARLGRDGQAGQPLELLGVVADDVPQVRARGQQHGVEPGRAGRLAHLTEAPRGIQFVRRHDIDARPPT